MKNLFAITASMIFLLSCQSNKTEPIIILPERCACEDSIKLEMLEGQIALLENQLVAGRLQFDSVKTKLFHAEYRLERVRYYLNICLRNPTQDKFLKGWVRRAIE